MIEVMVRSGKESTIFLQRWSWRYGIRTVIWYRAGQGDGV